MSLEIVKATITPAGSSREVVLVTPRDAMDARVRRQALPDKLRRAFNGDRTAYFKASFMGGRWKLDRRLPDQGW